MQMQISKLLNAIIYKYNSRANVTRPIAYSYSSYLRIPCKVKRFVSSTYGKYPISDHEEIITMEYDHFLGLFANYLPFRNNDTNFRNFLFSN